MCGIVGFVGRRRDEQATRADVSAMCAAIRHRGPDDEGQFIADEVALGMRRLSIIDVAGGAQPIANEDQTIHVVFNGEIYNHHVLRRDLAHRHQMKSHSDTEVLVHLYEDFGERMVHQLRGMFAFAIWDARRRRLFVARDRLGIKPLYYWPAGTGLVFASELRSLLALRDFPRTLDRHAVESYLAFGYVPDPEAIFASVRKLPPGHLLTWSEASGIHVEAYWSANRPQINIEERDAVDELRRLLADAVESHLESEVPLGAFLSGGVDSSTVVAEMARRLEKPVQTFAIGFDDPRFDESQYAASVARALGTRHTELIVRPDADELIEEVARAFDEPFGDSSALPTMLVSQLARQHVTVALSGDGGDELFGGYTRYAELLRRHEIRPELMRVALRHFATRLPHSTYGRNRLLDLARSRRGRYAATVALPLTTAEGGVVAGPHVESKPLDTLLEAQFAAAGELDFLTQMTLVDIATYLPGDILTKVDRASMSVSLEARVPLLDHPLVEFAVALPARLKYRGGTGKWLLRRAIQDLVPQESLTRPKQGFAMPLVRWFRRELRHRLDQLLRPDNPIFEFVDRQSAGRLVREHAAARRDHSPMLWRLLVLDLWMASLRAGELGKPTAPSRALAGGTALARAV